MDLPGTPRQYRARLAAAAFTLIELMVSMTVLTVIVVLISQLVGSATSIAIGNRKRLDADGQARVVFDRIASDLGKMFKRPDVDYLFAKTSGANGGGNDKMFFYSEAPAFYDNTDASAAVSRSSVALVGYRINAACQLERLGKQLSWDGSSATTPGGIVFLSPDANSNPGFASTLAGSWPKVIGAYSDDPPYSTTSDNTDYHVLAEQVCRLEFCFQLKDGRFSPLPVATVTGTTPAIKNKWDATTGPTLTDDSTSGWAVGSRWYDSQGSRGYVCLNSTPNAAVWNYLGMSDVRSVVVALAVLDGTSSRAMPTTQQTVDGQPITVPNLDGLVKVLADADPKDATPSANPSADLTVPNFAPTAGLPVRMMAEAWGNRLKRADFATSSGLPKPVAAQVRIYQRSFVLNNQ